MNWLATEESHEKENDHKHIQKPSPSFYHVDSLRGIRATTATDYQHDVGRAVEVLSDTAFDEYFAAARRPGRDRRKGQKSYDRLFANRV